MNRRKVIPERERKMYGDIIILSGAGISAESGIPTFRDSDGLWNNHRQSGKSRSITENIDEYVTARRCVPAGCFALQMPDDFCFFLKFYPFLCIFSKPLPQT